MGGSPGRRDGRTLTARLAGLALAPLSWRITLAVAFVVVVPPTVTLLVIAAQGTEIGWEAFLGPLTLGIAVVLTRVNPELGAAVLAVGMITTVGAVLHVGSSDSALSMAGALTVYLGVCWVTCILGSRVPLVRSAVWLAVLAVASLWRLGSDDVPILLLLVGWYCVGVILRSRANGRGPAACARRGARRGAGTVCDGSRSARTRGHRPRAARRRRPLHDGDRDPGSRGSAAARA